MCCCLQVSTLASRGVCCMHCVVLWLSSSAGSCLVLLTLGRVCIVLYKWPRSVASRGVCCMFCVVLLSSSAGSCSVLLTLGRVCIVLYKWLHAMVRNGQQRWLPSWEKSFWNKPAPSHHSAKLAPSQRSLLFATVGVRLLHWAHSFFCTSCGWIIFHTNDPINVCVLVATQNKPGASWCMWSYCQKVRKWGVGFLTVNKIRFKTLCLVVALCVRS